ncbi:unnamed protein product, partial [Phaeothamnion confervicola]
MAYGGEKQHKRHAGIYEYLPQMMFGFGDSETPVTESVELMDNLVVQYIDDLVHAALAYSPQEGRFDAEDLVLVFRNDRDKFRRIAELLEDFHEFKK